MRLFLPVLGLLVALVSTGARASTVTLQGNTTTQSNCIPFGSNYNSTPPSAKYMGFVYKNVPAFTLSPGDTISFDLYQPNDNAITMDIALAAASSNGSMVEDSTGFVQVVTAGTPTDPDGNSIQGDFELEFTADTGFVFGGGGLIIRFQAAGAYVNDTTCTQVLVHSNASDSSGYFVGRFYSDADGVYPWDGSSTSTVGNVIFNTGLGTTWYADSDGDGFGSATNTTISATQPTGYVADSTDCDDSDADTFPGAAGNDSSTACMTDADGDGYGDDSPGGGVTAGSDCNDANLSVNPGATEVCDSVDNDCDGTVDEASASDAATWYADSDSDSFGTSATTQVSCSQPSGYVADSTDCDDSDADTYPGAASNDSSTACMTDADGDGYGDDSPASGVTAGSDCNDSNNAISPVATEVCDSVDNDCDGTVDEDDAADAVTWYADSDSDGFGSSAAPDTSCTQPSGYVASSTDCDDSDADTYPGAAASDSSTACMTDADGDGYGSDSPGSGVTAGSDCNDASSGINPAATEVCDSVDNDCDGTVDEDDASDAVTWYRDADSDGYGTSSVTDVSCSQPTGYVTDATDCDDLSATAYPGAAETDSTTACMEDADLDGYGDASASGGVAFGTDCDDSNGAINPAADEVCDEVDNNCDGDIDEDAAIDVATWYADLDGDSYGDASSTDIDCDQPSGYVADDTDCDDGNPDAYPGAPEVPYDGVDQDCDSSDLCDVDLDGYDSVEGLCGGDDCDDDDAAINVDAEEIWYDGVDQDCDAWSDYDQDYDGQDSDAYDGDDCNDEDDTIYLGAPEIPDGLDNDCNGLAEDDDTDGDGLPDEDELDLGTDPNRGDTDEDGLLDGEEVTDVENPEDTDEDGIIDALDEDDDGDGILTVDEIGDHDGTDPLSEPLDTDGDGTPDHRDLDSDDDGRPDADEGMGDDDCDGILNWVDSNDADGACPEEEDTGGLEFREGTLPAGRDSCGGSKSWALPLGFGVLALAGLRRRREDEARR